jgi:hypothetical protein
MPQTAAAPRTEAQTGFRRERQVEPWSLSLIRTSTPLHVRVCGLNQRPERLGVDNSAGPELHVPHELAGAFEKSVRIDELCAAEEADVDVGSEDIHISERRVADAGSRVAVVQEFADVVAAGAHDLEPAFRDRSKLASVRAHPELDRRIAVNR